MIDDNFRRIHYLLNPIQLNLESKMKITDLTNTVTKNYMETAFIPKGPFIFYEGGGAGGIWEAPFKNRMTPPQLTNFFTWPPPLIAVIFWDDPPPKKN